MLEKHRGNRDRARGMAGADEPGLQQRIVGGECEERQSDRDHEHTVRAARTHNPTPALAEAEAMPSGRVHEGTAPEAADAPPPG